MNIPQVDIASAHKLLKGDYVLISVIDEWVDFDDLHASSEFVIQRLNLSMENVSLFHMDLNNDYQFGALLAPTNTALLYVLNIPDAAILDISKMPDATPEEWAGAIIDRYTTALEERGII